MYFFLLFLLFSIMAHVFIIMVMILLTREPYFILFVLCKVKGKKEDRKIKWNEHAYTTLVCKKVCGKRGVEWSWK